MNSWRISFNRKPKTLNPATTFIKGKTEEDARKNFYRIFGRETFEIQGISRVPSVQAKK
jgi:hypothetical protein